MKLMDGIWGQGRARGYAVTGLLAVVVFGGTATAADVLRSASDQQPAGDVFVTPTGTPAATTTDAPTVAPVPAETTPTPVAPSVVKAPAATVNTVTTPTPTPTPVPTVTPAPAAPLAPYDPAATWTGNDGKTYIPAVPPTMEKLPGEGTPKPATN